jgi:hypothetical protein
MTCLFASDYGPPEPGFDPLADGGVRIKGFEAHAAELASATNLGQLEAMERALHRGDRVAWCDPGYAWVDGAAVHMLFAAILAFVILPYFAWRLRLRPLFGRVALAVPRLSHPFRR